MFGVELLYWCCFVFCWSWCLEFGCFFCGLIGWRICWSWVIGWFCLVLGRLVDWGVGFVGFFVGVCVFGELVYLVLFCCCWVMFLLELILLCYLVVVCGGVCVIGWVGLFRCFCWFCCWFGLGSVWWCWLGCCGWWSISCSSVCWWCCGLVCGWFGWLGILVWKSLVGWFCCFFVGWLVGIRVVCCVSVCCGCGIGWRFLGCVRCFWSGCVIFFVCFWLDCCGVGVFGFCCCFWWFCVVFWCVNWWRLLLVFRLGILGWCLVIVRLGFFRICSWWLLVVVWWIILVMLLGVLVIVFRFMFCVGRCWFFWRSFLFCVFVFMNWVVLLLYWVIGKVVVLCCVVCWEFRWILNILLLGRLGWIVLLFIRVWFVLGCDVGCWVFVSVVIVCVVCCCVIGGFVGRVYWKYCLGWVCCELLFGICFWSWGLGRGILVLVLVGVWLGFLIVGWVIGRIFCCWRFCYGSCLVGWFLIICFCCFMGWLLLFCWLLCIVCSVLLWFGCFLCYFVWCGIWRVLWWRLIVFWVL